ncbi:MAG: L,D-transpeptidase family protein [Bacteroidia bacterium]|nr:L,D-transpeptidase family protein [Bacteroidia bacterium]
MKIFFYTLLFQCLLIGLLCDSVKGQESRNHVNKALHIAKKNAVLLDSINQLLVVFNKTTESNLAILVTMEKKDKGWVVVSAPRPVGIGRNGFAAPNAKREGDHKSPTGFFRLGQLFCNDKVVDTKMPFIQITSEDKWIDDPNSNDYNRHIRGFTQAKSYEKLKLSDDEYKYCMVIEYNMHPVVKGMGSAIFLHLWEKEIPNSTSGCVVLNQKDMEWILKWMNPESKPSIIMGNEKVLISGF